MPLPELKGKILFVFSDPGGAKPCLSLIEEQHLTNAVAVSDRAHGFYTDFTTPVQVVKDHAESIIDQVQPDLIFTGTSYTSTIEQQFMRLAAAKQIPCYAFVDHWTSFAKRFEQDGKLHLPDQVWVIDERAKQLAIEEGIDAGKIVVSGNPYHSWLAHWKPTMSKQQFMQHAGVEDQGKHLLVYAPDPLSNVNGIERFGFDELSATASLVKTFNTHPQLQNWDVLIKAHPNQNREKLAALIDKQHIFHLLPQDTDTNTCIYYADAVMGFFSSFLIEASIMHKPVLRFLEAPLSNDPIAELQVGTIVNSHGLAAALDRPGTWN